MIQDAQYFKRVPVISMAKTATEIDWVIPLPKATAPIKAYPCM